MAFRCPVRWCETRIQETLQSETKGNAKGQTHSPFCPNNALLAYPPVTRTPPCSSLRADAVEKNILLDESDGECRIFFPRYRMASVGIVHMNSLRPKGLCPS